MSVEVLYLAEVLPASQSPDGESRATVELERCEVGLFLWLVCFEGRFLVGWWRPWERDVAIREAVRIGGMPFKGLFWSAQRLAMTSPGALPIADVVVK